VSVGGAILSCCCDEAPSDPCVGVAWANAPQQLLVSGSFVSKAWTRSIVFGASQVRAEMSVQFDGIVEKGAQSGWNQGPNTNQLYSSQAIEYEWQVTQEVLEGPGTGDSETGSGAQAWFRIFCSKTGLGGFGLGPTPQALCSGEIIAAPPYVIGRLSLVPPYPPTTPNGPPIRPSFPWGGVQQSFPSLSSVFLNQNAGSGALSRFQPEVCVWVSTNGLTQGYQSARIATYLPTQSVSGGGSIPAEYDRCEWALDYAGLGALAGWDAAIVESQSLTVTVA